jgi:membrane-associated phospholipid phosphatase
MTDNATNDDTTNDDTTMDIYGEQPMNPPYIVTDAADTGTRHTGIEHAGDDAERPFWRVAPLHRRDYRVLAVSYVVLTTIYLAVGWMIVNWWESSPLGEAEADVNRWLEDGRTDDRTHLAELGSALSNTETKIALGLMLLPLMLWMFRRWHEWTFIVGGLILEVAVFGTTAKIIARDRPPVEQLDGAPTNSWPSGHIAAAVVFYVGLAIVIWYNPRFPRVSRIAAVCIAIIAPAIVIMSRLYLGMHYLSDAVGGTVLGLTVLAIMWRLLLKPDESRELAVPSEA